MKFLNNKKRGYTLLFAVLTASLVLGVAAFILGISRKQFLLSATARDSMFAIYAADSGIECVAHILPYVSRDSYDENLEGTYNNSAIPCNGDFSAKPGHSYPINREITGTPPDDTITTWTYPAIGFADGSCAIISMTFAKDTNGIPYTAIRSSGYNVCSGNPLGPDKGVNSRTVERALQITINGAW